MGRSCTVCSHEESFEINEALVLEKASNRTVAHRFGVHYSAVQRHREHIPDLLLKGSEAEEIFAADALLEDLMRIRASAFDLLDRAERTHDWRARIASIKECRENLRVLGELEGRLEARRQNLTINLVSSPEWTSLKAVIIEALRPHPAALEAVAEAVSRKEITNGSR